MLCNVGHQFGLLVCIWIFYRMEGEMNFLCLAIAKKRTVSPSGNIGIETPIETIKKLHF